jgi:hypothetical protein
MLKLIQWQCKCGASYGLEPIMPTTLHEKHPDRKKCQRKLGQDKKCGNPFPDQASRDKMYKNQYGTQED